jgi:thioesterase domain-containing protein/acyl carrier protein
MLGLWTRITPRSGVTAIVADAWQQVLDNRSFAEDTPFDQAGGDSLGLIKLIFLIEEAGNIRLPMEACNSGMRPSALVRLVQSALEAWAVASTEPPETVFLTADLPDWPEMIAPEFAMNDLIDRIAKEIGARAPVGAVRLAGYSFGGHVAFGAARALAARGREIAFLGILDTNTVTRQVPTPRGPAPIRALRKVRWGIHNLRRAWRRSAAADWFGEATAHFLVRPGNHRLLRLAARMRHIPLPTNFDMFVNIYLREELQTRMLRAWQANPASREMRLDAPVVLFRSQQHAYDGSSDLGWGGLCPRLHVVDVSGGHWSMLHAPYVSELCTRFIQAVQVNRSASA